MSDANLQDLASGHVKAKSRGLGGWFEGRGRRREFWAWVAPAMIAAFALGAVGQAWAALPFGILVTCAMIRRFHDLGRSGWWAVVVNVASRAVSFLAAAAFGPDLGAAVSLLPFLAVIVVLGALPGQRDRNAFGPPPGRRDVAEAFT